MTTSPPPPAPRASKRSVVVIVLIAALVMGVLSYSGWSHMRPTPTTVVKIVLPSTKYPIGVRDAHQPSGFAPPSANALAGYHQVYVNDFTTPGTPKGWLTFFGKPGGDPGGQFEPSHVGVRDGELILSAFKDPHYGDRWVTGGLCQCGAPKTYGAFFVRSRATAPGPNEVELLWPEDNQWPPEIDFNETPGAHVTTATVHWGKENYTYQWVKSHVDMLKWNTWGVVWTPTEIEYILNGRVWGIITASAEIPHLPMRLDLEQRTECTIHQQCPSVPKVEMQVDWVAEYQRS